MPHRGRADHLFARSRAGRSAGPVTGMGGHVPGTPPGRVIVVGAGPTGLTLAAELALAGVPCLVLERRSGPRAGSRAICLHARSMEVLDLRGQAGSFTEARSEEHTSELQSLRH